MNWIWQERFLELAEHVAQWSKDPSTKVGAVIVGTDKRKVAFGYNGFPPGIADDDRLLDRPTKYRLIQHAERNALDNCSFDPTGGWLFATHPPCSECAKSILTKGISAVVFRQVDPSFAERWAAEYELTAAIFEEAGITLLAV